MFNQHCRVPLDLGHLLLSPSFKTLLLSYSEDSLFFSQKSNARIIIANFDEDDAYDVFCEAYKLGFLSESPEVKILLFHDEI